jgi:hypothetical protein
VEEVVDVAHSSSSSNNSITQNLSCLPSASRLVVVVAVGARSCPHHSAAAVMVVVGVATGAIHSTVATPTRTNMKSDRSEVAAAAEVEAEALLTMEASGCVVSSPTIVVSRSAAPVAGAAGAGAAAEAEAVEAVAADGDSSTLRLAIRLLHAFRFTFK